MTTDRCPVCGAAVTPGAAWCTLCYADLRPKAESVPEPSPEPSPEPLAIAASLPSRAATRRLDDADVLLEPHPILDAPVHTAPVLAAPGWPCRSCGATVALSEDRCPHCGTPFLEPESSVSLRLPGVGDVTKLEKPQRIGLIFAGMALATALFVLLAFLLGAVI